MKRLLLILFLGLLSLQMPFSVISIEEAPKVEGTEEAKTKAESAKSDLENKQAELNKQIDEQQKKLDEEPENKDEQDKLDEMRGQQQKVTDSIGQLGDFINQAEDPTKSVNQEDLANAKQNIDDATALYSQLTEQLKTEFVGAGKAEEEPQEAVEKISTWDSFKLSVSRRFKEAQATIAEFFGAKDTALAARNDLNSIYEQLNEFGAKAQNAGKLAGLYKEFGELGNAIITQGQAIDAAVNEYKQNGSVSADTWGAVQNVVTDVMQLRDALQKGELLGVGEKVINSLKSDTDDFLGELGLVISEESAYEVLGLDKDATVEQIRAAYKKLSLKYHPDRGGDEVMFQKVNNAAEDLLGTAKNDSSVKTAYDKRPIVQEGFEISQMTAEERAAFREKKAQQQQAGGGQEGILGGG